MRHWVLTAVILGSQVFWVATLCHWVSPSKNHSPKTQRHIPPNLQTHILHRLLFGRGCQISFTVYGRFQNHIRFRSRDKQVVLKPLEGYIRFRSRLLFMFASPSTVPIPMAAPSKAWVYGRSLPGIAASNPARGMDFSRQEESYRVRCV